jgi:UDP-N-acetylmuramate-alanine ligase
MNFQDLKNQSKVHFIGLGGIGMSALAFILRELKIEVQGSDL